MKTIITNQFDKSFGPVGTTAGLIIFIAGIVLLYFNLAMILLVVFGAFVAFTNTSTTINTKDKTARNSTNLFGIIKFGKWINLTSAMQAKLLRNNGSFRAYSRGNRPLIVRTDKYKVSLFNKNLQEIIPLKYFDDLSTGKQYAEEINTLLIK